MVVNEFAYFKNLLKQTFLRNDGKNRAVSIALKSAIIGDYPNYLIDYSKIRLAEGRMDTAVKVSIEIISGCNVRVTWDTTVDGTESAVTDSVCLIFINTTSMIAVHKVDGLCVKSLTPKTTKQNQNKKNQRNLRHLREKIRHIVFASSRP